MKFLFIDCGTHLFQGFEEFSRLYNIDESWECHSFEANPITFEKSQLKYSFLSKKFNIQHYNKAVASYDGEVKINCQNVKGNVDGCTGFTSQGSNILSDEILPKRVFDRPRDKSWEFEYKEEETFVKAVNFSKFLNKTANKDDYVVVKMDIEGAEYDVLDDLIKSKSYKLINKLHCEFHSRFFENKSDYDAREIKYINFFKDNGLDFHKWI